MILGVPPGGFHQVGALIPQLLGQLLAHRLQLLPSPENSPSVNGTSVPGNAQKVTSLKAAGTQ